MRGLIALAMVAAQPEPVPECLPPTEQCAGDESFDRFRALLKDVVAARDERALVAMLSDDVEVNFGGDVGPALFAANWKFDQAAESPVWAELEEALSQGCIHTGDALMAPSFVAQFPDQLDAFETLILPAGTMLRSARDEASAGERLDWHLAAIIDNSDDTWIEVKLVDGRRGFVRHDQSVNPLDYRLVFEKRGGAWQIAAFVAGD